MHTFGDPFEEETLRIDFDQMGFNFEDDYNSYGDDDYFHEGARFHDQDLFDRMLVDDDVTD